MRTDPTCRHEDDAVAILGGVTDVTTGQITLVVTVPPDTPTATVLARVGHALDVHARPAALAWQRWAKAPLN